jgi:hypothetical protein
MQYHTDMLKRHYATNHPLVNPRRPIDWESIRKEQEMDKMEKEYLDFFEDNFLKMSFQMDPPEFRRHIEYFIELAERHWMADRKQRFFHQLKSQRSDVKQLLNSVASVVDGSSANASAKLTGNRGCFERVFIALGFPLMAFLGAMVIMGPGMASSGIAQLFFMFMGIFSVGAGLNCLRIALSNPPN